MTDQTLIDYWRNRINAIDRMLAEIPEQHITITSYALDLAGPSHATEPALPGGDRLDILGPWSSDATYGDQPTPRQVIVEWCTRIRDHRTTGGTPPRYTEALRYLRDETPWILESPYATAWCEDLDQVHGRLRALVPPLVDDRHDDTPQPDPINMRDWFALIPEGHHLTRTETETFIPDELTDTDWDRLRQRAHRARTNGHPIPAGKYPIEWIREHANMACISPANLSH